VSPEESIRVTGFKKEIRYGWKLSFAFQRKVISALGFKKEN
jgi:hypothetical protein